MKKKNFIVIAYILFFTLSCKKDKIWDEKEISLPCFKTIRIEDSFDVYLIQGTIYSVKFVADEKVIDDLNCLVTDSTLVVTNGFSGKWMHPKIAKAKVYITCDNPYKVNLKETCMLRTVNPITSPEFWLVAESKLNNADLDLNCGRFNFYNNFPCGGKVTLKGNCANLNLWNFAIMAIDAKELSAVNAIVQNNSKADCHVNVVNKLDYEITREGNIYLYNNPIQLVETGISGSGQLIKK